MNTELMIARVLGECTPEEASRVDAAVNSSPDLRRQFDRIRNLVETLRTNESVNPPTALVEKAKALLAPPRPTSSFTDWLTRVERIIADLIFDSRAPAMLAGFRGTTTERHLTFRSNAAELDIAIKAPDKAQIAWTVRGQVDCQPQVSASTVGLVRTDSGGLVAETTADERGRFVLSAEKGRYDLVVRLGDRCLSAREIELG